MQKTKASSRDGTVLNRAKRSNHAVELSDICKVYQHLLPGVRLLFKFTKDGSSFYLMNKDADSKNVFKFVDAWLLVNRVKTDPTIPLAQNATLAKGPPAWYKLTRVERKTFTFSSGAKSLSIDNAVLGPVPKRLLFNMV